MTSRAQHIPAFDPASPGFDGMLAITLARALGLAGGTDGILARVSRSVATGSARPSLPTTMIRNGQRLTVLICPETGAGRPDIGMGASGGGGGGSGPGACIEGVRLAA